MKSDVELQRDVVDELAWEPSIDAAQVAVTAKDGVATLTGHVATHSAKHLAEKAVKRVHGVKGIANDIEVRPSESHQRDDEHVAAAAVHALEWDASVPDDRIQAMVQKGWITLEGTVDQKFQKAAAARATRHLIGVRGLTNDIVVESSVPTGLRKADEIKAEIEAAFRRSASVNSNRVQVELEHHKVVLMGDVHSYAEREEAERIASTAGEVLEVDDCLTVTPWGTGPMEEWGY